MDAIVLEQHDGRFCPANSGLSALWVRSCFRLSEISNQTVGVGRVAVLLRYRAPRRDLGGVESVGAKQAVAVGESGRAGLVVHFERRKFGLLIQIRSRIRFSRDLLQVVLT